MALQAFGPDVSRWQGSVDWQAVHRAGAGFAIVKATEGIDFVDPSFTPARWAALHKAGLLCSAYHFARPQPGRTGGQEAHHFLKVVRAAGYGKHPDDLPLVLDLEDTKLNALATHKWVGEFVNTIFAETGLRPFIYVSPSFWKDHVQGARKQPVSNFGCPLWLAHYTTGSPSVPASWKHWTLWQHTSTGHVAGVSGQCDMNRYNGTFRELVAQQRKWRPAGTTPRPPKPPRKPPKHPPVAGHYPAGLPARFRALWDRPWEDKAARNKAFRQWLENHGYWTPNFKKAEAKCKDGHGVPTSLNRRARDHAFNLEKLRHELGDRPIPILSWYRTPAYNRKVGGASQSKHMEAIATDHARAWVDAMGRKHVLTIADRIFRNGGLGVYPWGAVHVDTRGGRARWSSW